MKKIVVYALAIGLVSVAGAGRVSAQATASEQEQIKAYMEAMRKDVRKEAQSIVDQAMNLEAGDKAKFWGIYEKFQGEMKVFWDQRLASIKKYADNYETMSDAVADELVKETWKGDQQRASLIQKYYPQMKAALGSKKAARWVQVQNVLDRMIGLQLASAIPLMPN